MPWATAAPGELNDIVLEATSADGEQDPARRRLRLFRGVLTWLTEQSRFSPLLVTFEDLHWCDENTLELIGRMARQTSSTPLLLLMTYRADEVTPRLAELLLELHRARALTELRLQPLSEAEVAAMLRAMFTPTARPRREQLDRIVHSARAIPFSWRSSSTRPRPSRPTPAGRTCRPPFRRWSPAALPSSARPRATCWRWRP